MQAEHFFGPDWRDAAAYAPLLRAERSLFAWEWLRRDPSYRAAAGDVADPAVFGLVAFEPAHLAVPDARPMWRSDAWPQVLQVRARPKRATGDDFDPATFDQFARVLRDHSGEHLLLSDGLRSIRLDGQAGAFARPACLRYLIEGLPSAEAPLRTLRQFLALCRTRRFSRSLHPLEARARRWILLLRTWDALASGADQREIAGCLLSRSVGERHWRSREPSVRSQVQRLVRSARGLAQGQFRTMLR